MRLPTRLLLLALLLFGLQALRGSSAGHAEALEDPAQGSQRPKATREDEIERFRPTEEVPADAAVSFPVDI